MVVARTDVSGKEAGVWMAAIQDLSEGVVLTGALWPFRARLSGSARGMPGHRVGRLWKFQQAEVDAWVRSGSTCTRKILE